MFGFYFVGSLLREAGWPRKQGLFTGERYDTAIADSAIDQMVDWAASIGAGRPSLALQMIAEMFRERNWDGDDAPEIGTFVTGARETWDTRPTAAPREVIQPIRVAESFGTSISAKDFQDASLRVALEQNVLDALLWGLANPDRFTSWYIEDRQRRQASLGPMRKAGLHADTLPELSEYLQQIEEIVRGYERDIGPLPPVPDRLLSDARGFGAAV